MIQKFLASLGFGSAKVDLQLDSESLIMGETVTGKLVVTGGKVEQVVENLAVHLELSSAYWTNDGRRISVRETVATIPISYMTYTIQPEQQVEFPFEFKCPSFLPISSININTKYYFQTDLEIEDGKDSKDRDYVEVKTNPSSI